MVAPEEDVVEAPATVTLLAPQAAHPEPPRISEPQRNSRSIGGGGDGADAEDDGGAGGVWSSLTNALTSSLSSRGNADASQIGSDGTEHGVDSVSLRATEPVNKWYLTL